MTKLYFYYSAMNAGKSTMLLQSNYNYNERGMKTLLYTTIDSDNGCKISSRLGVEMKANYVNRYLDLYEDIVSRLELASISCVFIDEGQFLTEAHVKQLCRIVDLQRIPVLVYGLRTDFKGNLFEGSQWLLALADKLIECKTICHCGSKATMNMKVIGGVVQDEYIQVDIGGNDKYISLCRRHHTAGVFK